MSELYRKVMDGSAKLKVDDDDSKSNDKSADSYKNSKQNLALKTLEA